MRKLFAVIMTMGMLFVSACSSKTADKSAGAQPAASTPTAQPAPAADGPGVTATSIKIGGWMPLSGPFAVSGIPHKAGTDAYFKQVNDKGGVNGRKIEWIAEDNAFDPQRTVAASKKLIEKDQVLAIFSPYGSAPTAATFTYVLTEAKTPLLFPYGSSEDWYKPVRENLYGLFGVNEEFAYALGRWAAKEGSKNILAMHNDLAATEKVAKNVAPGTASADPKAQVKTMPFKLNTTDWVPIALQVAQAKPDAIVFFSGLADLVGFAKELSRQGVKVPLYTWAGLVSNDAVNLGGAALEGLRGVALTVPPTADVPAAEEYRQALKAVDPKAVPDFPSIFAYAQAKVFVEAVSRIKGPITQKSLIDSLHAMSNYESGLLPPVSFTPTKHLGSAGVQRVMLENGKWKTIGGFVETKGNW